LRVRYEHRHDILLAFVLLGCALFTFKDVKRFC